MPDTMSHPQEIVVRDRVAIRGFIEKDVTITVRGAERVSQCIRPVAATSADATSAVGSHPIADGTSHRV